MKEWTLFLDRDGVINQRLENDYVKKLHEFIFIEGVLTALKNCTNIFGKILIVTNQRGISLDIMNTDDLEIIHKNMIAEIEIAGGKIDKIYYCPDDEGSENRKPNVGMARAAKKDFPTINFKKSIMVGDSMSDMEFGKKLEMKTVLISSAPPSSSLQNSFLIDKIFPDLLTFTDNLTLLKEKSDWLNKD